MKTSEKLRNLAAHGDMEKAKALAKELAADGGKQIAIDLYRCIIGNDRTLTRHLDHSLVKALAAMVEQAENAGLPWEKDLFADEAAMAFATRY